MRNKISKADRERATLICEIAASATTPYVGRYVYAGIERELGIEHLDNSLAYYAWSAVGTLDVCRTGTHVPGRYWTPERDAEAAALLRDGWNPGDPVVRR